MLRCIVSIGVVALVAARDFNHTKLVDRADVDADLSRDIADTTRLSAIEDELRGAFISLPKNDEGLLNHATAFYALHRLFNRRYGWLIKGLEPESYALRNASAGNGALQSFMKGWVPDYLVKRLEDLGDHGDGVNLHELAALAATLDDLILTESDARLSAVYDALGFSTSDPLDEDNVAVVMDTFMYVTLTRGNIVYNNTEHLEVKRGRYFTIKYKDYDRLSAWLRSIEEPYYQMSSATKEGLPFSSMSQIAKKVGEGYATFNQGDCLGLKSMFTDLEARSGKIGRVRLPDFYNKSLYSRWKLNEKEDYLRSLGALDDTNPSVSYIITANYISARSNCLEGSSVHAVCCKNECDELMSSLEQEIAAPVAPAVDIQQLVANLPSASVAAPRELSPMLLGRLDQVAAMNDGQVHLHGRLFAQWMHHAYPRECPFPHETGIVSPITSSEWLEGTGQESHTLSDEELRTVVASDQCAATGPCEELTDIELPWSDVEELLSSQSQVSNLDYDQRQESDENLWFLMKIPIMICLLAVVGVVVFSHVSNAKGLTIPKRMVIPLTVAAVLFAACIAKLDESMFAFMMLGIIVQQVMTVKDVSSHKKPKKCVDSDDESNSCV